MLTVDLKTLGKQAEPAVQYLRSQLGSFKVHGTQIQIDNARARDVKLQLHKFLHRNQLEGYRVEVVHPGLVEVFGPERTRPHVSGRSQGSPPSAGATMPYAFPFSPSLPGAPVKKLKAKKKQ